MSIQINQQALLAARDEFRREELIREQEQTILRTASRACSRYVTKSDDEWSIALGSFSRAIDLYAEKKGDFLPFAQMLIKRSLIDYFRSQKRARSEVPVAPHLLEGGGEPEEDTVGVGKRIAEQSMEASDTGVKDEIEAASGMLKPYGIRFMDLTGSSPRQERTRKDCGTAVRYLLAHPILVEELKRTKKLPAGSLAAGSKVSRKTLDKYRKYIIMAALILDGDYPHIAGYLQYMKEEDPQ